MKFECYSGPTMPYIGGPASAVEGRDQPLQEDGWRDWQPQHWGWVVVDRAFQEPWRVPRRKWGRKPHLRDFPSAGTSLVSAKW
jgi:hypothetical protein